MNFEALKLQPDATLHLQFHRTPDKRHTSRLIGYLPTKSVIVSTPHIGDLPRPTKVGEGINVRFFSEVTNSAAAFSAQVIHVAVTPYPHLHLSYPESIEADHIRKSVRVKTNLLAAASLSGRKVVASIINISTTGCRIKSKETLGSPGEQLKIAVKVDVAGTKHTLTLSGIIMAAMGAVDNDGIHEDVCGIDFVDVSPETLLILHAYVYYRLSLQ